MNKKELASYSNILGGLLIILWGMLHVLIIPEIQAELINESVNDGIVSLITLSYLGVVVLISTNGFLVLISAILGIKQGEKWAFYFNLSQGCIFCFVSALLIILQPLFSIMSFPAEFVLALAILTDVGIAILVLGPLILWHKEFI